MRATRSVVPSRSRTVTELGAAARRCVRKRNLAAVGKSDLSRLTMDAMTISARQGPLACRLTSVIRNIRIGRVLWFEVDRQPEAGDVTQIKDPRSGSAQIDDHFKDFE